MTSTRILTVAGHLGSAGGTEHAQLEIACALATRGHEVHLVYVSRGDYWPRWRGFAESTTQVTATLPARRSPVGSSLGFGRAVLAGARLRPDVTYVHNAGDVPLALGVRLARRAPVVAHLHLPPPHRQPAWLNALIRRADAVVVPSSDTERRWLAASGLAPTRLSVIPTGIDVRRFAPLGADDRAAVRGSIGVGVTEVMLLYAGRVERIKGAHFLLDACSRLGEPVHVVVCGASADTRYLDELRTRSPGNGSRVSFLGHRSDVARLMAAADLLVMPSNWAETQGLVIGEAMACGTPVVAADVGGLAETMRGFPRHLVPPADPVRLAEVIGGVMHWRGRDPRLGDEVRAWVVNNMSFDMTVRRVDEVLVRTASGAPS